MLQQKIVQNPKPILLNCGNNHDRDLQMKWTVMQSQSRWWEGEYHCQIAHEWCEERPRTSTNTLKKYSISRKLVGELHEALRTIKASRPVHWYYMTVKKVYKVYFHQQPDLLLMVVHDRQPNSNGNCSESIVVQIWYMEKSNLCSKCRHQGYFCRSRSIRD